MGYKIYASNVRLWKNKHTRKDGSPFFTYTVSHSKKNDDGNFVNKYVRVYFSKDIRVPRDLENGATVGFKGFPVIDIYTTKAGEEKMDIAYMVTDFHVENSTDYADVDAPKRSVSAEEYTETGYAEVDKEDVPF